MVSLRIRHYRGSTVPSGFQRDGDTVQQFFSCSIDTSLRWFQYSLVLPLLLFPLSDLQNAIQRNCLQPTADTFRNEAARGSLEQDDPTSCYLSLLPGRIS